MEAKELAIDGAVVFTPRQLRDPRGVFLEQQRADALDEVLGRPLPVAQTNVSVSRRGVLRGVHFAQVPPGQAKYVFCPRGRVLDAVIDLRPGSPTFGKHEMVVLDEVDRRALFIAEGLGHAFLAESDEATLTYLCSTPYTPGREHAIHPLDTELALAWPTDIEPVLSDRDAAAPSLREAGEAGLLSSYEDCQAYYGQLRSRRDSQAGRGQ
jgi:dTDP-4-dehydrorhamnose 3,5-epimerase